MAKIYAIAVFSNGLILCTNESQKKLIVLDKSGKVVSRFSFAGIVCRAFSDGNKIFIVEQRGPNPNGLVYDELFNELPPMFGSWFRSVASDFNK